MTLPLQAVGENEHVADALELAIAIVSRSHDCAYACMCNDRWRTVHADARICCTRGKS